MTTNAINEVTVQLWTLYVTVAIALVGFAFNVVALWQTKKATEDLAKPYINVYLDAYAVKDQHRVYVFKNFGQTPAYITNIAVAGAIDPFNKYHFQSLVGNMLAPGQKITSAIHRNFKGIATITISYKDQHGKQYSGTFKLDSQQFEDFAYTINESNTSDSTASAIRQSTMSLLRELR